MNISAPAIERPVATTLLTLALLLAGGLAYTQLPVAPLPQIDFPVISVGTGLPGASPETMASSVATPLERQFGRIAGINQMTSSSQLGSTGVTMQFDLDRNIDAAARDVQAAINAARGSLPADLPSNPTYRKINPADAPVMILVLTSDAMTQDQMYDVADSIMGQKLAQVEGVGQVFVWGSSQPAVRIEANPNTLNKLNIGLEAVRSAVAAQNVNVAKGSLDDGSKTWMVKANDQLKKAADYKPIIVAYRNGAAVRLSDVADVQDSYSNINNAGSFNGKPSVLVVIFRQPGANMIATADRVQAALPFLKASLPASINLVVGLDRTTTVRASVADVERTLIISVILVTLVVILFLREVRATMIPSVAVPLAIVGTFGVMYLCGFSLNNLSLMALTISTGFVVDDAIVVLENVMRHVEAGMKPYQAALLGAREIGFTVISMSTSLIAVFIPILLMGGIVGRLFREFAVTLSAAIAVSLVVSLTTTPMIPAVTAPCTVERARLAVDEPYLQDDRGLGAAPQTIYLSRRHPHGCTECMALFHRSQGIFSPAGYWTDDGHNQGRSRRLVPGHARQNQPVHPHCEARSGDRERSGFRGRQRGPEPGTHVRHPQASGPTQDQRGPGDRPAPPQTGAYSGRDAVLPGGAGLADRRTPVQCPVPVHAVGRKPQRTVCVGAQALAGTPQDSPAQGRE